MSTFSVGGLASGLDTKTIVSQLMSIEGNTKTKLQWQSQLLDTRKSAWTDLKTKLNTLKTAADALLRIETWDKNSVTASTDPWTATSGDPSRVAASVTGTPTAGSYALNVIQLAQGQLSTSSGSLAPATSGVRSTGAFYEGNNNVVEGNEAITALRTQTGGAVGLNTNSTITMQYTVNGITQNAAFKVNTVANGGNGTTLTDFANWVASTVGNGATAAWVGGQLQVTTAAGTSSELTGMSLTAKNAAGTSLPNFNALAGASSSTTTAASNGGASADTLTIANGSGSWNVAIAAGSDKQAIVNAINATSGIGVTALLNGGGQIELRSNGIGASEGFTVTSAGATASQLGFTTSQAAQDAKFTVNGTMNTSATNSGITSAISGVTLNLSGTTSTTLTIAQGASGSTQDEKWADAVATKMKTFVDAYNAVQSYVYQKTQSESRVASPSTLAEYLQGPMARNSEFANVALTMRQTISNAYSGASGADSLLSSIGVTTSFAIGSSSTNGQLNFDADAFETALLADPARVQSLLTNVGTSGTGIVDDDGFVRRISEQAFTVTGQIADKFTYNFDPSSKRLQQQIDQQDTRLAKRQEYYEHMFASMETMLGKLQSQSSWLSGQLSALTSSNSN